MQTSNCGTIVQVAVVLWVASILFLVLMVLVLNLIEWIKALRQGKTRRA